MNIKPELEHLRRGHPIQDILLILMGTFLFSASMNWIVLPHAMSCIVEGFWALPSF